MEKRGLSQVVTMSLLIMLSVMAILLLWFFFRVFLFKGSEGDLRQIEVGLEVEDVSIVDGITAQVKISNSGIKAEGREIERVKVIIIGKGEKRQIVDIDVNLGVLESKTLKIPLTEISADEIEKIEVYPIIDTGSGEKVSVGGAISKKISASDYDFDSLVSHYRFEDNLEDSTGKGDTGIGIYQPAYDEGMVDSGLHLVRYDVNTGKEIVQEAYIQIPNSDALNKIHDSQELTVTFWLKINEYHGRYRNSIVLGKGFERKIIDWNTQDFAIGIDRDKKELSFRLNRVGGSGAVILSRADIEVGIWYFIAVSYSKASGEAVLYIDQDNFNKDITIDEKATFNDPYNVGFEDQHYGTPMYIAVNTYGLLDELKIFNRALSHDEVEILWKEGRESL
jgi:hypothetical protein